MVANGLEVHSSLIHKDGASLFLPVLQRDGLNKLGGPGTNGGGPTDYPEFCSKHFEDSSFEQDSILAKSMGMGNCTVFPA